jgi:hypothetical protein
MGYEMKKIYYEKVGRRYVPVAEYDSTYLDSFPKGNHLVMCYPGGQSRRFKIDPAYAPMIAAGRVAEEAICDALRKASEMKPQRTPITEGQRKAWKKLAKEFGDDLATLSLGCARDIAEAGIRAQMDEAEKLLTHASVRKAYDHFMLICQLVKDNNKESV